MSPSIPHPLPEIPESGGRWEGRDAHRWREVHDGGMRGMCATTQRGMRNDDGGDARRWWGRCATLGWRSGGREYLPFSYFCVLFPSSKRPLHLLAQFLSPSLSNTSPFPFQRHPFRLLTPPPSISDAFSDMPRRRSSAPLAKELPPPHHFEDAVPPRRKRPRSGSFPSMGRVGLPSRHARRR